MTCDRSKPEQATSIQGTDSPEDMQRLLAETARSYREAKSLRIEREIVVTTESELMTLSSKSLFDVIAAPDIVGSLMIDGRSDPEG